ncbi:MAG TPA: MnhB domain-containing protein, partial [Aquamicrobium sp.]|nr:MnhB domain-containing protein [Aquamicrobium sp.]
TIASAFAVAYSLRFIHTVFFGPKPVDLPREPHEPPHWMRLPIELLVLICLIVGIIPGMTVGPYLHAAVVAVLGDETPRYSLAVWHGFNTPLLMSTIALVAGVLLYLSLRTYLARGEDGPPLFRELRGQRIFERILVTISWRWARWLEGHLGTRRLQPQLRLVVAIAFIAALWPLFSAGFNPGWPTFAGVDPVLAAMWTVGAICAIGAAHQAKYHRLAALILMGGAGIVTCVTFVWFSAPDLALTQLVVEIVTTVLILLGLRWLPKRIEEVDNSTRPVARMRRHRDFALAALCGTGMAMIAYAMMTTPLPDTIGDFFLTRAYTEGGGTNVVNVILVDFRGFDTFGEITVLGIVALTVFALLRRFRPAADSVGRPEQQRIQNEFDDERPDREVGETVRDYLMVPAVIMQWMFPVTILLAAYIFLRGHDLPGGGFAAGIVMAIGFLLQYIGGGTRWVEDRLRILPVRWIGAGLLMAAFTGMGAWLFGMPFLTSYFQYTEIPLIGKVPTASALLFDLGVFSLVVGATVLMLIALAHQSVRSHRVRAVEAAKAEEEG